MLDALLSSPKIMLLVCAIVITVSSRVLSFAYGVIQDGPDFSRLQKTVCVVSVVPPGCGVSRVAELLRWAGQPSCIRLHIFEYAARRSREVPADLASIRHRIRPARTYDPDAALSAAVRDAYCDEAYLCVLPSSLSACAAWDEELIRMHDECAAPAAALTTLLPAEQAGMYDRGNFLRVLPATQEQPGLRLASSSFQGDVDAPVPQAACCARFLFGGKELALALLDAYDSEPRAGDLELSRALWTRGVDFFAPSRAVLWSLPSCHARRSAAAPVRLATDGEVRTAREYAAFSGIDVERARLSARGHLGLTATASAYELSAKYGTREDAEELLATHPANALPA